MTNKCFSLVRGRVMRVTRLDACGKVIPGAESAIVSDGFITVGLTAQTDEGTTISVTNAAGDICILDEPCPTFTGYEIAIEFCGVNPTLYKLLTGQNSVLDSAGNSVGFRMNSDVNACNVGFALEVWSQVPTSVCEPGSGTNYGYFLVPFSKGGIISDFTIGNDVVNFSLAGTKSKDGSAWGVGPYNVISGAGGSPAPLALAINPADHLHMQLTTVPPPTASCDAVAVGVPATGANGTVAGEAVLTPANSYAPAKLTSATPTNPTPTPATAWAAGSYMTLGDGSKAKYSGTAWVSYP
jgi:hypothetical protein